MMKRTQIKDALRNIGRQKVSFLSIVLIAFLGVTTFLGIDYSAAALRRTGSNEYNRMVFRDVEIVSTMLLTREDLQDIRDVEGVADAEPVWQTEAKVTAGTLRQDADVISLTERINLPVLQEGQLPTEPSACAVEERLAKDMGWQVGDRIDLLDASGNIPAYLTGSEYEIVGIVNHPDHTNPNAPEDPYIMVLPEAFDEEELDGCFMKAEVMIERSADTYRFSDDYEDAVAAVSDRLEELGFTDSARRYESVRADAQKEIDDGQQELDDSWEELVSSRAELDDGWTELTDGETELADSEQEAADAQTELEDAQAELEDARAELVDAQAELNSSWAEIESSESELAEARENLDSGEEEWAASGQELTDAKTALDDSRAELDAGWTELANGETELTESETELQGTKDQLDAAWQELQSAQAELTSTAAQLASSKEELDGGKAELDDAKAELDSARETLISDFDDLEGLKAMIRNEIRGVLEASYGDTSGLICWAGVQEVEPSDSDATASEFWITETYRFDMSKSLAENVSEFMYSGEVPDEVLLAVYLDSMGGEP